MSLFYIYTEKEFRPEIIIAVSGCVPALIGDDIDGILADLQSEVAATLIPVTCEGFKTKVMATAEVMQDLGLEVVGLKGHHIDEFVEPSFEALENIEDVVFSVATQQPFEQVNIVNKLKLDVIVIHGNLMIRE